MAIRKNMGALDRIARGIAGLALLGVSLFGALAAGWDIAVVAATVMLWATAATGFCPGYVPFGISTRREPMTPGGEHDYQHRYVQH